MRTLRTLLLLLCLAWPASAQVSIPYTFSTGTIKSAEVNANFGQLGTQVLNRTGGTMIGTLTVNNIAAASDASYSLGTGGVRFLNGYFSGTIVSATQTLNLASAAVGDLLYLGSSAAVTRLADVATGRFLQSGGVGVAPSWGLIPAISSTYFTSLSGTNLTGVALLGTANTFTARNDLLTYTETKTALTPSGAITVDLSLGTHFTLSNTTTATFTFSNPPTSGKAGSFTLAITGNGTSHAPTWPASVKWPGGAAPTITTTNAKVDVLTFITYDGGTTWYGFVAGQNF